MYISVIKLVKAHVWYDHYSNCNDTWRSSDKAIAVF
jgi:hypothetical protein